MTLVAAILFAGMGLLAILAPAMLGGWVGQDQLSRDAANEFRAVYGGFGLAMAAVLLATDQTVYAPGVRLTVGVALAGMAGGRIIATLLDGAPSPRMLVYGAFELAIGLPLVLA